MYEKYNVQRIKDVADLKDVASDFTDLKRSGKDFTGKCQLCGSSKLTISPGKDIFKCWSCNEGGKGAINYLMKMERKTYKEALAYLAEKYNILPDDPLKDAKYLKAEADNRRKNKKTFRDLQLESSGLTDDDVRATVYEDNKTIERSPFTVGMLDQFYRLVPGHGDDMVIWYYDLEGRQVTYVPEKSRKTEMPFFRIRFSNPDERKDKFGKSMKYYSPKGSGSHLYIPERVRKMYRHNRKIKRLFLQEGEKKAEKACKHGLMSVGVMGIHNIGANNVMPKDLQLLIQKCEVDEVVFLLDADWQDLSTNIKVGDNVQRRPLTFFYAVRNFKEYMLSFRNIGINLEVYFGAPKTSAGAKGIDDILAGPFKGKEDEFVKEVEFAINAKDGQAENVEIHKITALTDYQIKAYWKLNHATEFAAHHREILQNIPEFTIHKTRYRINEEGNLELAEPILEEERYWNIDSRGKVSFNYKRCYTFLRNRGYGRIRMVGARPYVHFRDHVIKIVERTDVKDFIIDVTEQIANEDVQNMLYQGGHFYLGDHSLENMKYFDISFEKPAKDNQNMHFKQKMWKITADSVTEHLPNERTQTVWEDKIIDFEARILPPLVTFDIIDDNFIAKRQPSEREIFDKFRGSYWMNVTETGKKANFLQFIINTSNFYWRDKNIKKDRKDIIEEYISLSMHTLNKLTAFGYLAHRFQNAGTAKAVIAMDGKLSEVGASNGRSGKSIFGIAVGKIVPQVYIGGKRKNLTEDQFLFEEVNEKTENVFFDDIRANIDFEFFFPNITGRWMINRKGIGRITLPVETSPKLLFTTNHALNGDGSSFRDRQHFIVFSDYYNDNHKPADDFGRLFFDEWDHEQWNLFYNLVASSLQMYFRYGLVIAPSADIELRRLRQQMGEDFLTWAEEYYSEATDAQRNYDDKMPAEEHLNMRIERSTLYNDFLEKHKRAGRYMTPTRFGKCIKWYCKYKGYHLNTNKPHRDTGEPFDDWVKSHRGIFIGQTDKSAGHEFFTISLFNHNVPDDDGMPF